MSIISCHYKFTAATGNKTEYEGGGHTMEGKCSLQFYSFLFLGDKGYSTDITAGNKMVGSIILHCQGLMLYCMVN